MLTACYAAKGGQGCTTITAALAMLTTPATIIDLAGDIPAVLGLPDPYDDSPGLAELLTGTSISLDVLFSTAIPVANGLRVVPSGRDLAGVPAKAWKRLGQLLAGADHQFYVDAGTTGLLTAQATRRLLVIRHCYLALRRAQRLPTPPDGIVTVREQGRALTRADVEEVIRVPVLATVEVDPAVARAVDAGILAASRLPDAVTRSLRELTSIGPG